jgi:hypothetical protein
MPFQSFEEALKICLTAENGSPAQDEALVYCMEHAPEDLKEMLKDRFVEFHAGTTHEHAHEQGRNCRCGGEKKPHLSDFIK